VSSSASARALRADQAPRADVGILAVSTTWALAAAVLAELLLLRLLSRTAVHVPAEQPMLRSAYEGVLRLGNVALDAAHVLLPVSVVLVVASSWTRREAQYGGLLFAAFALTAVALRLGWIAGAAGGAASAGLIAAAGIPAAARWRSPALALYLVAFESLAAHTVLQGAGLNIGAAGRWLLWGADALAIAAGLALAKDARAASRRGIALGLLAALVVSAMLYGRSGWTLRFLTLWNFGLAASLPGALYAAAVGVAVTAATRLPARAWPPIVLLAAGGLGLHNTYQSALALAGLVLLLLAAPAPHRERR